MIGSDTDVWPTLVRLDSAGTPSAPVSLLSSVATSGASTAAICVRVPASVLRLPPALLSAAITDDTGRSAPLPVALVRGRPLTAVCSADVMVLLRLVVRPALPDSSFFVVTAPAHPEGACVSFAPTVPAE